MALSFVASQVVDNNANIDIPASAQVGDLAILFDFALTLNGGIPAKVIPTDFDEIQSVTFDGGSFDHRGTASFKELVSGDPGSTITGQTGGLNRKTLVVFRSDVGFAGVTPADVEGVIQNGDVTGQTISSSNASDPYTALAAFYHISESTTDTFSPAPDSRISGATDDILVVSYLIENSTPADVSVDLDNTGDGGLFSFYIEEESGSLSASGSPQADDATAGGAPSEYSCEIVATPSANQDGVLYQRDDGTEDNRVRFARVAGDLHVIVTTGGVEQADLNLGALTDFTEFTVRAAFAGNDIAASLNGAAVVTDNTVTLPDPALLSHRRHGADSTGTSWNAWIKDNREYPSRVPNAELENGTSASGIALIADGALTAYTTLTRNSTATYWDASSELQTAAIDTARTDHDPADGSLRGLLIEDQRTNLVTQSEDLTRGDWSTISASIAAHSDSKFPTAWKLTATVDNDAAEIRQNAIFSQNEDHKLRIRAKAGNVGFVHLSDRGNGGWFWFDLDTIEAGGGHFSYDNAEVFIKNIGDGWRECTLTADGGAASNYKIACSRSANHNDIEIGDFVYIAAPQANELEDSLGSYTPTGASTASREADNATSTVPALAFAKIQASGLPQADDATASGEIGLLGKASGSAQADDATAAGSAFPLPLEASGSPQAGDASASGSVGVLAAASGSPQADNATADGSAETIVAVTGSPQAEDATGDGSLNVFEKFLVEEDRRILTVVEIDYDFCQLTYGMSPCAAVLGTTGDAKCFNTRATCQDTDNYDRGTKVLRFIKPCGYEPIDIDAIPSVAGVSTAAARLRPGQDLGERASVSVSFVDHRYHDRGIDKYARERVSGAALDSGVGYDPNQRGTFWGKFRARYPFFRNRGLRVYQGTVAEYAAGGLAALETRHYIMDTISGPDTSGRFTITAKDVLKLADEDKAQAPRASKGELSADITDSATSFTLNPSGIGNDEYPASGYVTVGNEVMSFTRSGDDMTVVRGEYGTDAEEHSDGDTVQLAIEYDSQKASAIVEDLLVNYANVPASFIPSAAWETEDDTYIGRLYGALLTEPEGVGKLVSQLCQQVGFTNWWNEIDQLIEFKAIRQPSAPPLTLTDDANFREATPMVKEQPKKRISQVWVYYGVIDPTESVDEARNYRSVYVGVDANAESDDEYGQPQIKKIYARWIDRFNQPGAQDVANRMLSRYRDAPRKFDFEMAWDQENVRLGDAFDVRTRLMQKPDGADDTRRILVTSYERGEDRVAVESEEFLYQPDPDDGVHRVVIDADTTQMADGSPFNLRTAHDDIYSSVSGSDTVELIIEPGVILGSNTTDEPACDIGDWPENPTIKVIVRGRIQGAGGDGGDQTGSGGGTQLNDGQDGGVALYTRQAIELDNQSEVWSGGGGGIGVYTSGTIGIFPGRGGGGAGYEPGDGNGGYDNAPSLKGTEATTEEGGVGSGSASDGGDPGEDGQTSALGGTPGSAGDAIDGDSFVTYTTTGDIRGPQIN